ncbi:hypothetical protein CYMTET_39784 [Cymbomonas tetramitiformis]|uniref:PiggyBac transposable element-derived protein domain-containing protein n=1 Tax=Cymbomonas tetramitiformis TaxID=36881 RepID=A0AAE0C9D7_9CHLO|nr:hypothetical protein CYMTET_39784 [Cymbomonas tetramitiformis]
MGHELKSMVCSDTRIMFAFEIQEGKELDNLKKYVAEYGATCAMVLRLVEPYKSSGRVLVGDSWFGSVKSSLLLSEWDIFSVMNVKTAHKFFVKNQLLELLKTNSVGEAVSFSTTVLLASGKVSSLHAVGHKGPGRLNAKRKKALGWGSDDKGVPLLLVTTCATTLPAEARSYQSSRPSESVAGMKEVVEKFCPQVEASYLYRSRYSDVDKHNRKRTGTVAIHDVWRTQAWEHRDFGELLAVMNVNGESSWTKWDSAGRQALADQQSGRKVSARTMWMHGVTQELFRNPYLLQEIVAAEQESDARALLSLATGGNNATAQAVSPELSRYRKRTTSSAALSEQLSTLKTLCKQVPIPRDAQGKPVHERCSAPGCKAPDGRSFRTMYKCEACHMVEGRPAWVCSSSRSHCWDLHVLYARNHGMAHTPKRKCVHKKAFHTQEESVRVGLFQ